MTEPILFAGLNDPSSFWAMTVNHHPYVPVEKLQPAPTSASESETLMVARLSAALIQKFEELSMIHQFTEQLRLDLDRETICRELIEPLSHCVRAETFAIELFQDDEACIEPTFFSAGLFQSPQRMKRIADAAAEILGDSMGIFNHTFLPGDDACRVIVVPIRRNQFVAGRIIALGHQEGKEFGSIEADLIRSMAMMLAVHLANQRQFRQIQNTLDGTLTALVSALEAKDEYTCGHSTRVAELSSALARDLRMGDYECELVKKSAMLHDIGKIGVDDSLLRKPGQLTTEEFDHIKRHPVIGFEILKAIRPFASLLPGVLHHHEAWNGSGYPHGLCGEDIPRMAQIIAVADAFDAMTSDRPYRLGMEIGRVRQIFQEGAGVQWAPDVASLLVSQIDMMFRMVKRDRESKSN